MTEAIIAAGRQPTTPERTPQAELSDLTAIVRYLTRMSDEERARAMRYLDDRFPEPLTSPE
jgi:hypothetical protein